MGGGGHCGPVVGIVTELVDRTNAAPIRQTHTEWAACKLEQYVCHHCVRKHHYNHQEETDQQHGKQQHRHNLFYRYYGTKKNV